MKKSRKLECAVVRSTVQYLALPPPPLSPLRAKRSVIPRDQSSCENGPSPVAHMASECVDGVEVVYLAATVEC